MNPTKYRAKRTKYDGITFHSAGEARRYAELKLMERAGLISGLTLQPKFELQPAFTDDRGEKHRAITYKADFQYRDLEKDCTVVEDFKGYATAEAKIKMKMFRYLNPGYDFRITK